MQKEHIKKWYKTDTWSEIKVMYVSATRYTLVQVPCNSSSSKFPESQLNIFVFFLFLSFQTFEKNFMQIFSLFQIFFITYLQCLLSSWFEP